MSGRETEYAAENLPFTDGGNDDLFGEHNEMLTYFSSLQVCLGKTIKNKQVKAALRVVGNKDKGIILSLQAYKANSPDV